MSETDTSDDARSLACPNFDDDTDKQEIWMEGWDESKRRCEQKIEQQRREDFNAGWEAVSEFAGDQGWRDPLVDPDMARDKAYRAYRKERKCLP